MEYRNSNVNEKILQGLDEMGFVNMTPIQEMAIPVLLKGRDIIGQAQTGTGKTAAFGIPMISRISHEVKGIQGLVLCPTRELAIQAAEQIKKMAKYAEIGKVVAIYGGQDIEKQFRALRGKVSIIVGTPGRVMDHMRRGTIKFDNLSMLVLDEADEMLNMGFREDIETICDQLPMERQTALFSATMPDEIMEITEQYQKHAAYVKIENEELTIPLVKQSFYVVKSREKDSSICRLLDYVSTTKALIFCNTKRKVDELTLMLKGKGYSAEALHGDLSQQQRDRVMNLFRNGKLNVLLATDVAARGIDVSDVDTVFNYDMPQDMEFYVHRIGRTGRAGKKGRAISLITNRERYKIESLEEYCNTKIKEKDMPTAASALMVKAYKNMSSAMEYCEDKDLTPFMKIVYKRCADDGIDPMELAAAFLRVSLGEIEVDPADEEKRERRDNRDRKQKSQKSQNGRNKEKNRKSSNNKKNAKKGKHDGKRRERKNNNRRHDKRRTGSRKK